MTQPAVDMWSSRPGRVECVADAREEGRVVALIELRIAQFDQNVYPNIFFFFFEHMQPWRDGGG
jgi:hypothetical protein